MKFEVSSKLEVGAEEIRGGLTMKGLNVELSPFIRMTAPAEWATRPIFEWPVRQEIFSSWILLFGILPIDRHRFHFQSIGRERGFVEESSSLANRLWRHRRDIAEEGAFCRVSDTVEFQCRLPLLAAILAPVYRSVFEHRHQVLRSRYCGKAS